MGLKYEITTLTGYYAGKHKISSGEISTFLKAERHYSMDIPSRRYVKADHFLTKNNLKKSRLVGNEIVYLTPAPSQS